MTTTTTRSRAASVLGVVALAASTILAVGCGDGRKSAEESLRDLEIDGTPAQIVTNAVERLDPRAALGQELGRDYLQLRYALQGYAWADAACAADATIAIVTPDVLGEMPVRRIDSIRFDHPDVPAAARACASPESLARLDSATAAPAPDVPGVTTTTTSASASKKPQPAPDLDGAAFGTMLETFYRISADGIGLTDTEIGCIVEAVLGPLDAADFADVATGRERIDLDDTEDEVVGCLKGDRIDVVTPVAAKALVARQRALDDEHDRVEALLNEQLAEAMETTIVPTTVAG